MHPSPSHPLRTTGPAPPPPPPTPRRTPPGGAQTRRGTGMLAPWVVQRVAREVQSKISLPARASSPTGPGAAPIPGCVTLERLAAFATPRLYVSFQLISRRRRVEWQVNYIFPLLPWFSFCIIQGPRANTEQRLNEVSQSCQGSLTCQEAFERRAPMWCLQEEVCLTLGSESRQNWSAHTNRECSFKTGMTR